MRRALVLFCLVFVFSCVKEEKTGNDSNVSNEKPFSKPLGIAASSVYLLVANGNYTVNTTDWTTTYDEGFVTLMDRKNMKVLKTIKTSWKNPSMIYEAGNYFIVIESGGIKWDNAAKLMIPETDGGIELFPVAQIEKDSAPATKIQIKLSEKNKLAGAPNGIAILPDGKTAYIGSGTAGVLFKVDLQSGKVLRGSDNPIELVSGNKNNSTFPVYHAGLKLVLVASGNTDQIFAVETTQDFINPPAMPAPLTVGKDTYTPEMPWFLAIRTDGKYPDLFVLLTAGNAVNSVDTRYNQVNNNYAVTGVAPNRMYIFDKNLFIVNSVSSNIQVVDLDTNATKNPYVAIPENYNPYDMTIYPDTNTLYGYVTNLMDDSVSKINLTKGEFIGTIR
jgi:hypothetical protein